MRRLTLKLIFPKRQATTANCNNNNNSNKIQDDNDKVDLAFLAVQQQRHPRDLTIVGHKRAKQLPILGTLTHTHT